MPKQPYTNFALFQGLCFSPCAV